MNAAAKYKISVEQHSVCVIRSPFDPKLRASIRAIPGRFWDGDLAAWTIRLGPDRAEAIARLGESYPYFFVAPPASEVELTRFGGHSTAWAVGFEQGGCPHATNTSAVSTGVPS